LPTLDVRGAWKVRRRFVCTDIPPPPIGALSSP
jgi:hypothetical protein